MFIKEKLMHLSKSKGGLHVLLITGIFHHYMQYLPETSEVEVKYKC